MRFHPDVATQLRALAADADTPGGSLLECLDSTLAAGLHACPSLLAVTLTVTRHEQPTTLSAQISGPSAPVRSSLRLRLPGDHGGATLTLHASRSGALDQLGADLPALLDVHRDRAVLDQHLTLPADAATHLAHELRDTSTLDRALGVLLERGVLPEDGLHDLERSAAAGGTSLAIAARHVLAGITPTVQ